MLKKRITASLVVKGGKVVQSIGFNIYLPVGSVPVCVEFLNSWGIDEIIILDIDATKEKRKPNIELTKQISQKIFVPLTVGGGITTLEDIHNLIASGADKISINKAALVNPEIISQAASIFGAQCIVVSMDVKRHENGSYEVFSDSGKNATGLNPVDWAKKVESLGAGEILVNAIDRDGRQQGYDAALIKIIADAVKIPVIALGGAGKPSHFEEVLQAGALAAAAGNFFHFTEHSPITVKSFLRKKSVNVRLDTQANYQQFEFDQRRERIKKKPDEYLEKSRFEYIPEEII